MRFSLNLDEALFDDNIEFEVSPDASVSDVDDDFVDYEETHSTENVLPGPSSGADTGVSNELINLINDEWEAIQGYTNMIATLRAVVSKNSFYEKAIKVLEEISAEENVHVGQLQELLKHVSPNAAEIAEGHKEAKSQLGFVGGVLPVQSWETSSSVKQPTQPNEEICTISDIDDEM